MSCIEIAGPRGLLDRSIRAIQEAGLLHLEEIPTTTFSESGILHRVSLSESQSEELATFESLSLLMDEAVSHIPPTIIAKVEGSSALSRIYRRLEQEELESLAVTARTLHAKVRSFVRRRRNIADDLRVLSSYEEAIGAFAPLVEASVIPREFEVLGLILDERNRQAAEALSERLAAITRGESRTVDGSLPRGRIALLAGFPKSSAAEVHGFIAEAGISQMSLPRYLRDLPFEQALARLEEDLAVLRKNQSTVEAQADLYFSEQGAWLAALRRVCRDRWSRLSAVSRFACTRYTFIVRGWIPARQLGAFRTELRAAIGESLVVREYRSPELGTPPVLLTNSKPVRQFEPLLSFFPLPRYGTIDPTAYIAAFFPPIFGLMLGDIGYGALLGAGALVLYLLSRGRRVARNIAFVAGTCALFSIVFGALFGELFGSAGHALGLHPLWRERFSLTSAEKADAMVGYILIAVGVGVTQVILGLVLGIVNGHRLHDRAKVLGNLTRIAGIAVIFFFVGRLVQVLPPIFSSITIVALVIFLALMIYVLVHSPSHGFMAPLEVLSTVGNILSYVRIMAIGAASVVLTFLAATFGGLIQNIALAVIVVALVHVLNLALGIIDPTIQGLRLHYVEFFSKFYEGGGTPYRPFRKMEV